MIHRKLVPINVMLKLYPQFKNWIQDCQIIEVRQTNTQNYTPSIQVAEAWCRNSYKDKGRHVICLQNVDLLDEEYDKDYFPVVKVEYNKPIIGYLGQSVVDELSPIQGEIDRILTTMQSIMKQVSVPRVFVDTRSNINTNHMTNRVGVIVTYDGQGGNAPIIHNGAAMPPELPAQLEFLIAQGYARVGLSTQDTQGMKPSGLTSGEALKTLNDQKSERWQTLQKQYEQTHVNLAQTILREIAGLDLKLVSFDDKIGMTQISTKKIPKDAESFVIQMFPVSALPSDPVGRIDTLSKYVALGVLTPDALPDLLNIPDLNSRMTLLNAPRKYIEMSIEQMMDKKVYTAPEPYNDLAYGLSYAIKMYAFEQTNDNDQQRLTLLRRYINDVRSLIAQASPQPTPPQLPPAGQAPSQPTK